MWNASLSRMPMSDRVGLVPFLLRRWRDLAMFVGRADHVEEPLTGRRPLCTLRRSLVLQVHERGVLSAAVLPKC